MNGPNLKLSRTKLLVTVHSSRDSIGPELYLTDRERELRKASGRRVWDVGFGTVSLKPKHEKAGQ